MSIDLSLDRLRELTLHLPPYTRPTIHIAGTNGKGSVSAILTSTLLAHPKSLTPFRIGRFNSPHLVTILDCISINSRPISRSLYDEVRGGIEEADRRHGTHLSNFELLTVTALRIFEVEQVDIVILEVGMGGRLDATNIVPSSCILASVLTAVDLDHQAFLGDTVEKIAREKAGIARAGKAFVLGKQLHTEVRQVVSNVVEEVNGLLVPTIEVERDLGTQQSIFSLTTFQQNDILSHPSHRHIITNIPFLSSSTPIRASFPLHGDHQLDNLGAALAVINVLLEQDSQLNLRSRITIQTIEEGIRNVSWPGRLSFHTLNMEGASILVLADGAHNRASAETLAAYIENLLESTSKSSSGFTSLPITFILGLSHSPPKTPVDTLAPLFTSVLSSRPATSLNISLGVALLPFTPPEGMPWVKSVSTAAMRDALAALAPGLSGDAIWVGDDIPKPSSSEVDTQDNKLLKVSLQEALRWAAERHSAGGSHKSGELATGNGLVVVAGSLYLVADFYRLLENMHS